MKVRSTKTIAEAIFRATQDKTGDDLTKTLSNTVSFLKKNKLLLKSNDILKHLEHIVHDHKKNVRAKVITAHALTKKSEDELKDELMKRYNGDSVQLTSTIDPHLIGGIRIEVNDEIIDLSLRNKLSQLEAHLITN